MARCTRQCRHEMFTVTALTLFPEMFPGPLGHSLAGKALKDGRWALNTVQIKAFATDKHQRVDGPPSGGGAGLVMRADVLDTAIESTVDDRPLIYLTPRGAPIRQETVRSLAAGPGLRLLCGRYEGVDQRVLDKWQPLELSMADFILSGGEIAALSLIDACVRLVPGVMGNASSGHDESFENGLLEYPLYTKPRVWQNRAVPDVLVSGDHGAVEQWRLDQSKAMTQQRRPDLWTAFEKRGARMDRDDK